MNRYILVFMICSLFGWVWESIYCSAKAKKWANRGFLYGPICPIYGSGAIIGFFLLDMEEAGILSVLPWWGVFAAGFVISMLLEYPTSWALEKLFHARWWDYSNVPLNLNGRTSVPTSIAFGGAAIFAMKIVLPAVNRLLIQTPEALIQLLALLTVAILSADATLTVSSLTDFQKHVNDIDAAFQSHMTEAVAQAVAAQSGIKTRAAQRIAVFKLSERKIHISRHLLENTLQELIKELPEQLSVSERIHRTLSKTK